MPGLYLDEQVTERLTDALNEFQLDASSANRVGNKGLNDALQLLYAAQSGKALVTFNAKDFVLLHNAWHAWSRAWAATAVARHAGILVIYSSPKVDLSTMAEAIWRLTTTQHRIDNRLFGWDAVRGWREIV